jgi:hypothetical protein
MVRHSHAVVVFTYLHRWQLETMSFEVQTCNLVHSYNGGDERERDLSRTTESTIHFQLL